MEIHRTKPTLGLTLSVKAEGPTVLLYKLARNGKPVGEGRMTLVENGKAWVDISWPAGQRQYAGEVVYVKHDAHPERMYLPIIWSLRNRAIYLIPGDKVACLRRILFLKFALGGHRKRELLNDVEARKLLHEGPHEFAREFRLLSARAAT